MDAEGLPPIDGDPRRWYISGRTEEMRGRFSLQTAEFQAISRLIPLVAQYKGGFFEVACLNARDEYSVMMLLAGIRSYAYHKGNPEKQEGPK